MKMKLTGFWTATILIGLETLVGGVTDLVHLPQSRVPGAL
jgi:hypothetical protein